MTREGHAEGELLDTSSYVDVDGAELYAERVGPASAAAVYYLHGGPGYSSHSFRELMGDELQEWQVVYADMRGGGRSFSRDGRGSDLPTLAADVTAVQDAFGIARAVLLAHGFGALVAVEAALRTPERVSGLVLVNPWLSLPLLARRLLDAAEAVAHGGEAGGRVTDEQDDERGYEADEAALGSGAAMADAAFTLVNPKALFDALEFPTASARLHLEHVDAEALSGPQEEDASDAVWDLEILSRLDELDAAGVPVVILAGELDGTCYPEQVEAGLSRLPGALFGAVHGGHYPWLDDPETFTAVLRDALTRLAGPAAEVGPSPA